jgi:hypothetical protein
MGISLYRKGNTHTIRGVICEMRVFKVRELKACVAAGWNSSPKDIDRFKEADSNETGLLSVDEVRASAKKAGIRNWHNKKIDTLKKELGYV